jgi:hypothetical protein
LDGLTRRDLLAGGAGVLFAGPAARAALRLLESADAHAATGGNVQQLVSRPDLKPPTIAVLQPARSTAPGLVFVAPSSGPAQRGAMIFDDAGALVWFHPVAHKAVTDFKVGLFRGKPVLTWPERRSPTRART